MHVILTPVGSAGDVNPFVVIGRELRRRGHRATLLSPDAFAGVAGNAGLEFVSTGTNEEYELATNNPDLWHPRRGPSIVFSLIARQLRRAYAAIDRIYDPTDTVLVGHPLSFFTRVFEEAHAARAVTILLSPSILRSDFAQSALPSGQDLSTWPRWATRTLWWAIDHFAVDPMIAPALNAWRAELGLPPVSRIFESWLHSPQRVIGIFPAWFGDPQPDWPAQLRLTGFVLSDEMCAPDAAASLVPPSLDHFMTEGDPPFVFTPGTANRHAAAFFRAAIDGSAAIGRRALLVTPYREQLPATLPPHASHTSYAAFGALFPRAAAVVHHGGIGTCAQALAAGVPQLVMPMGFDQPDNALRLHRLGVGDSIPPAQFTASRVAAHLSRLVTSEEVRTACGRWRDRIDGAAALAHACSLIEAQYEACRRQET